MPAETHRPRHYGAFCARPNQRVRYSSASTALSFLISVLSPVVVTLPIGCVEGLQARPEGAVKVLQC